MQRSLKNKNRFSGYRDFDNYSKYCKMAAIFKDGRQTTGVKKRLPG